MRPITSPIDGVVIGRGRRTTVASGFETPTLFTIAADLMVVADVDEPKLGDVEEEDDVA